MDERVIFALAAARGVIAKLENAHLAKTIWGSPAGKKTVAKRLAALLPYHRTYTEVFAGSGAVFFAKRASPVEVINDADPEIADAYRMIGRLQPKDIERLKTMPWVGDLTTFNKLKESKAPKDDVARLHRFIYLSHFAYRKFRGRGFNYGHAGVTARSVKRIEEFGPRLRNAKVYNGDYERVVRKYDTKDAVHFLDPPYRGYQVYIGESSFDEQRFFRLLKEIKGKFLVTYGIKGALPGLVSNAGFWLKRIRVARSTVTGRGSLTQLLIANYEPLSKSLGDDVSIEDWTPECANDAEVETSPTNGAEPTCRPFAKTVQLLKGADPTDERYILGIVLEPEVVDAQGDIYSAEEIRSAAHKFMQDFGTIGFMHQAPVTGLVKVLETFLAPTSFEMGDVTVKKGTWLLAVRVLDDGLWAQVKAGDLTGFSIGGSAKRVPEPAPPETPAPEEAA